MSAKDRGLATSVVLLLALTASACTQAAESGEVSGEVSGGAAGGQQETAEVIRMARADWETGHFQAAVYRELLEELGYEVTDPARETHTPATFYPALIQGQLDLWANGWFPLHEPFLEGERLTGQTVEEPIEPIGRQVPDGAVQGYLVDRATAEEFGITSMDDLAREEVRAAFDHDRDGRADLYGCNDGWGCNLVIDAHLSELDWGSAVEQVVDDYDALMADVRQRIADGEPALFYTWTPNWTTDTMVPGEDVLWLESPALPDEDGPTSVEGLRGCAGEDPCDLGWVVNDIRAVANTGFLDDNPEVRRLLEVVELPLADIAAQNARMHAAEAYTDADIADDAQAWIETNRALVDGWLAEARG